MQDLNQHRTSYFNMGDVAESDDVYPMADDHRELLYSVVGYIRQVGHPVRAFQRFS
jgi:hypothetical protein